MLFLSVKNENSIGELTRCSENPGWSFPQNLLHVIWSPTEWRPYSYKWPYYASAMPYIPQGSIFIPSTDSWQIVTGYVIIALASQSVLWMQPGPWFNIKMSSYQYRKSHCGDKTVVRSSYLHNGISYTGKMTSIYWISLWSHYNPVSFLDHYQYTTRLLCWSLLGKEAPVQQCFKQYLDAK